MLHFASPGCETHSGFLVLQKYPPIFSFVECVLPWLQHQLAFILIHDRIFPDPDHYYAWMEPLLRHPNVTLYASNPAVRVPLPREGQGRHKRVQPIPLGLGTPVCVRSPLPRRS